MTSYSFNVVVGRKVVTGLDVTPSEGPSSIYDKILLLRTPLQARIEAQSSSFPALSRLFSYHIFKSRPRTSSPVDRDDVMSLPEPR